MKDYTGNIILSTAGTAMGIDLMQIQAILGLIITVINLVILIVSIVLKLIKYIKNDGVLDKEEITDLLNDTKEIKEKTDELSNRK